MNKLLVVIIGLAAGLSALAQGDLGTVNVKNSSAGLVIGGPDTAYKGLPVPKAVGRIEVLDGTGKIINGPADGTGKAFALDGQFFLNVTEIPGTSPGGTGSIVLKSWDSSTGATWDAATTRGQIVVTLTGLGGGAIPAPAMMSISGFTGMAINGPVIPEPSTVALAGLGLVGLLYVARRK